VPTRVDRLTALARGAFTPFLVPPALDDQLRIAREWRGGAAFPGAPERLAAAAAEQLGGAGWTAIPTDSGRAAIAIGLEALELSPGSEVIIPSYACWGLGVPLLAAGLKPVLADVDDQLNLSLEGARAADGPDVEAVLVAHLGGAFARDTEAIVAWARERSLAVIEDVAQAVSLLRGPNGQAAGTLGDVAVFSTGPGKLIAAPGGGWLATRDAAVAERARARTAEPPSRAATEHRLRTFARTVAAPPRRRGWSHLGEMVEHRVPALRRGAANGAGPETGFPIAGISDVEAQMALAQWDALPAVIESRRAHAARWRERLRPHADALAPAEHSVQLKAWARFDDPAAAEDLRRALWRGGVETEALYTPLHLRRPFDAARRGPLPVTERVWQGTFSLPARPSLTDGDWARIDAALDAWDPPR
jgi:dTDP-4-dehydro-2,3,6-trideoxy-D-glucose 4-aminotransferase